MDEIRKYTVHDFSAFEPKAESLARLYPELAQYKWSDECKKNDLLFAWMYGCQSSPINELPDEERVQRAFEDAYRSSPTEYKILKDKFLAFSFTAHVNDAISFFQKVDVSVRLRAKFLAEFNLGRIEAMAHSVAMSEVKDMSMDEKKKYTDFLRSTIEALPELIKNIEGQFAIYNKKEVLHKRILLKNLEQQ